MYNSVGRKVWHNPLHGVKCQPWCLLYKIALKYHFFLTLLERKHSQPENNRAYFITRNLSLNKQSANLRNTNLNRD